VQLFTSSGFWPEPHPTVYHVSLSLASLQAEWPACLHWNASAWKMLSFRGEAVTLFVHGVFRLSDKGL